MMQTGADVSLNMFDFAALWSNPLAGNLLDVWNNLSHTNESRQKLIQSKIRNTGRAFLNAKQYMQCIQTVQAHTPSWVKPTEVSQVGYPKCALPVWGARHILCFPKVPEENTSCILPRGGVSDSLSWEPGEGRQSLQSPAAEDNTRHVLLRDMAPVHLSLEGALRLAELHLRGEHLHSPQNAVLPASIDP